MLVNVEKYHYRTQRKGRKRWVLPLALFLAVGVVALGWAFRADRALRGLLHQEARDTSLHELWNNRLYDEIITNCEGILATRPLDAQALVFRGFSYFYKAMSEAAQEERVGDLEESIVSLRRSTLQDRSPWPAERDYVLGKAYFHKGKYYYDLAIRYLEKALAQGYTNDDIYDYLGLAYTQLDRVDEGLKHFLAALEKNPTDLLLLTIAQTYLQLKNPGEAKGYLTRAVNKTEDPAVERKSRFLLGQIYFDQSDYFKSEKEYLDILGLDPQSADAHFYLGEIYQKMGDTVKARAEWRKTLGIDPAHYGARLRYYR